MELDQSQISTLQLSLTPVVDLVCLAIGYSAVHRLSALSGEVKLILSSLHYLSGLCRHENSRSKRACDVALRVLFSFRYLTLPYAEATVFVPQYLCFYFRGYQSALHCVE